MNTLVYRGDTYDQHKSLTARPAVMLTYRRQVCQTHQTEANRVIFELNYRGVTYTH